MTIRRVLIGLLIVLALPFAGNATAEAKKKQTEQDAAQARAELQSAVMRFSDHLASRLVEGFSEVEKQDLPTEVWRVAFEDLLFATQAAYTIAVDPSPRAAVLDLVVLVSLGRIAYEDDRIPKYGETFAPMRQAFQSLEPEVWAMASIIRASGMTGNPGKWSCRCSSARVTFFTAAADLPDLNSMNLSIQIQRIGFSSQKKTGNGISNSVVARRSLPPNQL
jgi:hypothetical protein